MMRWLSVAALAVLALALAWASCASAPAVDQVVADGFVIRGHFTPGAGPVGPAHYCRDASCRAQLEARRCLEDLACIVATGRHARAQALLDEVAQ